MNAIGKSFRGHLKRKGWFTILLYAFTAAVFSLFLHFRGEAMANVEWQGWWKDCLSWLLWFFPPLAFAYSYPRHVLALSTAKQRRCRVFQGLALVACAVAVPQLASSRWESLIRGIDDSIAAVFVLLLIPVLLMIAALFLLLKGRSILTRVAAILIWPYWLLVSLLSFGRGVPDTWFYFLCFFAPLLFAFAAGAVRQREAIGHVAALFGAFSFPWLYRNVMKDSGLGNVWTAFNVPDRDLDFYFPAALLSILTVAFVCLGVGLAGFRLLPSRVRCRQFPLRERTWPALVIAVGVLAIWFSQSVMPYRISGAVDYADYPDLKILHINKKGLRFHEELVSVSVRKWGNSFGFSNTDRRLFRYRFTKSSESGKLPTSLMERVNAFIQQNHAARPEWNEAKPLRAWNADAWYVYSERSGLRIYTGEDGRLPPSEVVSLFMELRNSPREPNVWRSDVKDVCLGFCYDPLSAMGSLYANHRCHIADNGEVVCR